MALVEFLIKAAVTKAVTESVVKTVGKVALNTTVGIHEEIGDGRSVASSNTIEIKRDKIEEFIGENAREVAAELYSYGFDNIIFIPLQDLIAGFFTQDLEVEKITIAGKDEFKRKNVFPASARVAITYHTYKGEKATILSSAINQNQSEQHEEVCIPVQRSLPSPEPNFMQSRPKYCSNCGEPLTNGARFCQCCGTRIDL